MTKFKKLSNGSINIPKRLLYNNRCSVIISKKDALKLYEFIFKNYYGEVKG